MKQNFTPDFYFNYQIFLQMDVVKVKTLRVTLKLVLQHMLQQAFDAHFHCANEFHTNIYALNAHKNDKFIVIQASDTY
jgi:hypothetical protein